MGFGDIAGAVGGFLGGGALDAMGILPGGTMIGAYGAGKNLGTNPVDAAKGMFGNENQVEAAKDSLNDTKGLYEQNYQDTLGKSKEYMDEMKGLYGSSPEMYQEALQKYASSPEFSYNKDVKDFASPAQQMRVKEAMNAITKSQANAGNMFSSDYLNSLNAKAQAMASEEYDKAYNRMLQDRQLGLSEYNANQNKLANMAQLMGADQGKYADALGNYYTTMINAGNAYTNGIADLNNQGTQLDMQKESWIKDLLNPFG